MTDPESVPVVVAFARVMRDVQAVAKGDRNPQQGYSFRGVDAVVNAAGPVMRKHGVIIMPSQVEAGYRDVTTSTGKPSRECTVKVKYRIYGPAGDYLECEAPGESMDFGDKGAPKAMSVAYRIALTQALCLPTHEPEPDAATYQRGSAPVESPADQARSQLRTDCARHGWDLGRVAERYADQYPEGLRAETDASRIEKFRLALSGVPQAELVALNGAPA